MGGKESLIPDILKKEIDKKADTVDKLFKAVDEEFFWCIRIDDLKEILERYFQKDVIY